LTGPLPGETLHTLVASVYFVPILSGLGAIQLSQQPDGILSLLGHQKLQKRRQKERKERLATAVAVVHDGNRPDQQAGVAAPMVAPTGAVLTLSGIVAGYGDVEVLHGVDLFVAPGQILALLGANGAGKSTLCAVAAGVVIPTSGGVFMAERDIGRTSSHQRAADGLLLIPEARGIFPGLTVEENLRIMLRSQEQRERAYDRFPILRERKDQVAGLLSGGQQQMLSLAPALAEPPAVLIADEPTLGLSPLASQEVMDAILELREHGTGVLIVEEHAHNALRVADTIAVMELGRVTWTGPASAADVDALSAAYLGRATVS
jgi:ABC-type branched-subunit amino acid transport system ATPase component